MIAKHFHPVKCGFFRLVQSGGAAMYFPSWFWWCKFGWPGWALLQSLWSSGGESPPKVLPSCCCPAVEFPHPARRARNPRGPCWHKPLPSPFSTTGNCREGWNKGRDWSIPKAGALQILDFNKHQISPFLIFILEPQEQLFALKIHFPLIFIYIQGCILGPGKCWACPFL